VDDNVGYNANMCAAGDVNGDGYGDILVGTAYDDDGGPNAGAVYLVHGPILGDASLSTADAKFIGEAEDDQAGVTVSGGTDLDDDGYADILIGARYADQDHVDQGISYLFYGPVSGTVDLSTADARLIGEEEDDRADTPKFAGDFNLDGVPDILVGAYRNDEGAVDAGAGYLVHGPVYGDYDLSSADAKFVGDDDGGFLGISVSGNGDVNGDGYPDVLLGAYNHDEDVNNDGAAFLVYGPVSGSVDMAVADARLIGEAEDDQAGYPVSIDGDVNGDGNADVLVGAWGNDRGGDESGAAYLFFGPIYGTLDLGTADAILVGEGDDYWTSKSGTLSPDVNGDGLDDILLGAACHPTENNHERVNYLVYGPVSGIFDLAGADARFVGESPANRSGWVNYAGDLDGDGYMDLLLGDNRDDEGASNAGAVYVVYGGGW